MFSFSYLRTPSSFSKVHILIFPQATLYFPFSFIPRKYIALDKDLVRFFLDEKEEKAKCTFLFGGANKFADLSRKKRSVEKN